MIEFKDLKPPSKLGKGAFTLIYGPPDSGKTHNTIESVLRIKSAKPMLYIMGESKGDVREIIEDKIGVGEDDILCLQYDESITADDFLEFLFNKEKCAPFGSIFLDGYSHLMKVKLMNEITEQAHKKRSSDGKVGPKKLMSMTKTSVEDHGVVNNLTKRVFTALGNRSMDGKIVIMSAHEATSIEWDGETKIGPDFSGKEIPRDFRGFFTRIGYVTPRFEIKEVNGKEVRDKVFPPMVSFRDDGSFVARGGGVGLLDFSKILKKE